MTAPALSRPRTRWQRLAKLAREEGVAVRVNQVTGEVTFLPNVTDIPKLSGSVPVDAAESFESLDDYKAWRDGKDARHD